jgi:8-oxo-dGTP pyrophosphatase MutT (NUDIX family)
MPPALKKATTVILLREETRGFGVYLLKRSEKSSFMPANFVYPGGMVDPEDSQPAIYDRCKGVSPEEAHRILGKSLPPEEGLSYWVAGIRELFEEAGVLLAYDQKGNLLSSRNPAHRELMARYRGPIQNGNVTMAKMAQEEKLFFAVDQVYFHAHWITPEAYPQRFDTYFFLARHPVGQEASHDQKEMTAGMWVTPQEALERNSKGEMVLSPPTLKTIEDLSLFTSLDDLFTASRKNVIEPVLPILKKVSNQTFIVYPWDPYYPVFQQGDIPDPLDHGRPSQPGDRATRILFREGRWHLFCR